MCSDTCGVTFKYVLCKVNRRKVIINMFAAENLQAKIG